MSMAVDCDLNQHTLSFCEQMEDDFIFAFPCCLSRNGMLCFLCLLNLPSWCISGTLNDWRNSFQTLSSPGRGRGLLTLCQKIFSIFSSSERRYMYFSKVVVTFAILHLKSNLLGMMLLLEHALRNAGWIFQQYGWSLLFYFLTLAPCEGLQNRYLRSFFSYCFTSQNSEMIHEVFLNQEQFIKLFDLHRCTYVFKVSHSKVVISLIVSVINT